MKAYPFLAVSLMLVSPSVLSIDSEKLLKKIKGSFDNSPTISLENLIEVKKKKRIAIENNTFSKKDLRTEICLQDEKRYTQIHSNIIALLEKSYTSKNSKVLSSIITKSSRSSGLMGENLEKITTIDGISKYSWNNSIPVADKGNIQESLNSYFNNFSKIESAEFNTFKYYIDFDKRDKSDLSFKETQLLIKADIRGIDSKNNRRNDKLNLIANVIKEGKNWKISSLSLDSGNTLLLNRAPAFNEITKTSGVSKIPTHLRREAIRRGGYGLSLSDINNDGNVDIFVGSAKESSLLIGNGEKFQYKNKHTMSREKLVKAAIFADYDNDGDNDAIVTRFVPDGDDQDVVYYKNNGNSNFSRVSSPIKNKKNFFYAMPAAVADFDRDGYLDFYVGFPGAKDFTFLNGEKGHHNVWIEGLFKNTKDGFFEDKSEALANNSSLIKKSWQQVFPHSAIASDFDQDGDSDLVVIDDRNNLSPVYRNDSKGNFKFNQVAKETGLINDGYGMSIAAGDYDNDGLVDYAVTNVSFVATERVIESCQINLEQSIGNLNMKSGVSFYKNKGRGKFVETTQIVDLDFPGEGLAGIEFIDYNNDGLQDIYVKNGLWSGTNKENDLSSLFVRSVAKGINDVKNETLRNRSQSDFMDILSFYEGDVRTLRREKSNRPSMGGFQRNRLYRNEGNGNFTEVGYLEQVDSIADGYIVAKTDIDRDGRVDLVLRNGDPGTKENSFPVVQIFKNNHQNSNSLTLKLKGSLSNKNAIGALIKITSNSKTQIKELIANNGPAQSELLTHFGLGSNKVVDQIDIRWPSGNHQILKKVKSGFHTIIEPTNKTALK